MIFWQATVACTGKTWLVRALSHIYLSPIGPNLRHSDPQPRKRPPMVVVLHAISGLDFESSYEGTRGRPCGAELFLSPGQVPGQLQRLGCTLRHTEGAQSHQDVSKQQTHNLLGFGRQSVGYTCSEDFCKHICDRTRRGDNIKRLSQVPEPLPRLDCRVMHT